MKKPTFISLCTLFLILPLSLLAQSERDTYSGGAGYFAIGYGNFLTSELQNFLPEGSPELSNHHMLTGGGGYAMINDFIIGGSGYSITGESVSTDSYEANTSGGTGFFNVGYRVASSEDLNFYPLFGIGGGGLGMEIKETNNLTTKEIVEDPGRAIQIDQSGWLVDFSVNLEWYPISGGDDDGHGGLLTGLKVGYIYQPFENDWEYEGGNINNTPDFNLSGFYAQLTIGGGGFSIDND